MIVSFIDDIRIKAGQRSIQKQLKSYKNRRAKVTNLKDAKSIALLFKVNGKTDYLQVQKFSRYLKEEFGTRKIFTLGYWDDKKENPDYLKVSIGFDFFTRKDLDWKGIPNVPVVDNFLQEQFDILVDMNDYYNVPLRYVMLKAKAGLKVGRYSDENKDFFDLMLASNDSDFEGYCNQLVKYLTMVNGK